MSAKNQRCSCIIFRSRYYVVNTEANRNFATHSDLSVKLKLTTADQWSWETFENMIGDVIDTFRITIPTVTWKFVRKNRIETSTCPRVWYSKNWHVNHVVSGRTILLPKFWEVFTVNNAKMNKYQRWKAVLLSTGTYWPQLAKEPVWLTAQLHSFLVFSRACAVIFARRSKINYL